MKITFLGGAGTVTGSKYLIESGQEKYLVDCGLFQGLKELRLKNWDKPPFSAKDINAIILTHAHIDHSGYLPLMRKNGFKGPVFCTNGTKELCEIMLPDAGKLQEEEAEYANKKGYSKHNPALPLFTVEDAEMILSQFRGYEFNKEIEVGNELKVKFIPSGHILGASIVELLLEGKRIVFSGDLGRYQDVIMKPPQSVSEADFLFVESTYGNRLHGNENPIGQLQEIINSTAKRKGVVIIPAFAVGRSQAFMFAISQLKKDKLIDDIPVYLNSPMSINVSGLYCDHRDEHRLTPDECKQTCNVAEYVKTVEQSKELNTRQGPMIIISASGMATGGRVVHHLKEFAPDERNTILLAGYQAKGTRGHALLNGAQFLKIHGQQIPIRAKIETIQGFSAHADQAEIMTWLKGFKKSPQKTFIVHGESDSSQELKAKIENELGWSTTIPQYLDEVEL